MKLQLDTTNKTIKIEDAVKIEELIKTLKRLLPNNEWQKFTLETNITITHWNEPIVIERWPRYRWELPWYSTTCQGNDNIQLCADSSKYELNSGTYNVEL